jgi:hypothetical protein
MSRTEMPHADCIRATRAGRVWTAALLLFAMVLITGFAAWVPPFITASFSTPPSADTLSRVRLLFVALCVLAAVPAAYLVAAGLRITQLAQFPLPNAWVWRDTPVKRGAPARRIGRLCIAGGCIALVTCAALCAYAWIMLDRLRPVHMLRPGVVILQEQHQAKP